MDVIEEIRRVIDIEIEVRGSVRGDLSRHFEEAVTLVSGTRRKSPRQVTDEQ